MTQAALLPSRHKVDVDQYYRMAGTGVFQPGERVELIDGDIIDMAPIGQEHEGSVIGMTRALVIACGDRALVSAQNSVRLGRWSAPQPDFAVLRFRADFYRTGERAGPQDVLLLIEVADSSLHFDGMVKLPLYAQAGIAEVWIIDVAAQELTSYRDPTASGYAVSTTHRDGETIAIAQDPQIVITLDRLF